MTFALAVNKLVLFLRNETEISIEDHLVNSIVILELTFKWVSATISYSKSFQIKFEVSGFMESVSKDEYSLKTVGT